jgi:basic amino acid/polyamine antiporter, APA family
VTPSALSGAPPARRSGLWDAVSILIGVVIGVGIYETARLVFSNVLSASAALGMWVAGG